VDFEKNILYHENCNSKNNIPYSYLQGYPDLSWDQIDFDDLEDAQNACLQLGNCGGVTWTWALVQNASKKFLRNEPRGSRVFS